MANEIEQAEALVKTGQPEEALNILKPMLATAPDFLQAHSACAAAYMQLGEKTKVLEHLEHFFAQHKQVPQSCSLADGHWSTICKCWCH